MKARRQELYARSLPDEKAQWTQIGVARKLGWPADAYGTMENASGQYRFGEASVNTRIKLAKILDFSLEWLVNKNDPRINNGESWREKRLSQLMSRKNSA